MSVDTHFGLFNIFNTANLHQEIYCSPERKGFDSMFPILGLLASSNDWSVGQLSYLLMADSMIRAVALLHYYSQKKVQSNYRHIHNSEQGEIVIPFGSFSTVYDDRTGLSKPKVDALAFNFVDRDFENILYR